MDGAGSSGVQELKLEPVSSQQAAATAATAAAVAAARAAVMHPGGAVYPSAV